MDVKELQEQVTQLTRANEEQTKAFQEQTKLLEALTDQLKEEKTKREAAEAMTAKNAMVQEAIDESKKKVSQTFRRLLERCETKEEMLEALKEIGTEPTKSEPMPQDSTTPLGEQQKPEEKEKALIESVKALHGQSHYIPGHRILEMLPTGGKKTEEN